MENNGTEAGQSQERAELEGAIDTRIQKIGEDTASRAKDLLGRTNEATAARVLSMHEQVNGFLAGLALRDPNEITGYIDTMHEALKTLLVGVRTDQNPGEAVMRQKELAKSGKATQLSEGVKNAIRSAGGNVGPTGEMFVQETKLR